MEKISFLTDDPALIETIAGWHQETWGRLTGRSVAERVAEFAEHLSGGRIPFTLVAFVDGTPVGTASLLTQDMDSHPDLTPWLGSVFVLPDFRRGGIGERLCRTAVAEAKGLGVERLYLFSEEQAPYYARMGWVEMARERFHGERVTLMKLDPPG